MQTSHHAFSPHSVTSARDEDVERLRTDDLPAAAPLLPNSCLESERTAVGAMSSVALSLDAKADESSFPKHGRQPSCCRDDFASLVGSSFSGIPFSWRSFDSRRSVRPIRTVCRVRGASGSMDDFPSLIRQVREAVSNFTRAAWTTLRANVWARWTALLTLLMGGLTILLNTLVVSFLNDRFLPDRTQNLAQIMERDVSLGKVKWVLPTGLFGVTTAVGIGPVEIGPGSVEKSELRVEEVQVGYNLVSSLLGRELSLSLHCNEAEAKLVQADNYSWFGRPVDTTPSSTDFVPGLHKVVSQMWIDVMYVWGQEPEEVDKFMGMGIDQSMMQSLAKWTEKLAKIRNRRERQRSQYTCSTSAQTESPKESGRRVVASFSADVTGADADRSNDLSAAKTSVTEPVPRMPPRPRTVETARGKRKKLATSPKETSHGVVMRHLVRSRQKGEVTGRIPPRQRSHQKRKAAEEAPETTEDAAVDATSVEVADAPATVVKAEELTPAEPTEKAVAPDESAQAEETATEESERDDASISTASQLETEVPKTGLSVEELNSLMKAGFRLLAKHFPLTVRHLRFEKGTILAYATQEEIPREFVNTRATVVLGKGYHSLSIDLQSDAHKRNARSVKWTRVSPAAPKHLRFVTPGAQCEFDRRFPHDDSILRLKTLMSGMLSSSVRGSSVDEDGLFDVRRSHPKAVPPPSRRIRAEAPQSKARTKGRPRGGSVHVKLSGKDLFKEDCVPDLSVSITGRKLHVPLLERLLDVPIDVQDGRAEGTVHVRANSPQTWQTPRIDGQVQLKDVDMHFWDAPDHVSKANFGLIAENNKMYFHNASGYFGALPLVLSGDMDLDPEYGEYRLTAVTSPVEFNVARATFGIRPMPNPVAGAVQGIVHCTGTLRTPVFSGVINCVEPTEEMLQFMEESHAKAAVKSLPGAVGAFDKVPFVSAKAVFTHDTRSDVFTVHDFSAQPAGGGKLRGRGQLWVAPSAEHDPQALHIRCEGSGIAAKELIRRYVPENVELPRVLDCGATHIRMSMKGSHANPLTEIRWESPSVQVTGEASLSRQAWKATAKAPSFDISGTVHVKFPEFESTKQVFTQREMTELCKPKIKGVDSDIALKGCDLLPLFSNTYAPSRVKSGQAVRLKVSGDTHIKARQMPSASGDEIDPQHFQGEVSLQGLRMNQLSLAKQLVGHLSVRPSGMSFIASGQREDEMMDVSITLPEEGEWRSEDETTEAGNAPAQPAADQKPLLKGAHFRLKQGRLGISSQVNCETNRVQMHVRGLTLDELELASLRGELQDLSLDLNFLKREGRGELQMTSPRYSGLMGRALSGGFRWERDVLRLERMMLEQEVSRYEVQGEYAFPTNLPQTERSVDGQEGGSRNWLPGEVLAATAQPYIGRWRLQVNVPQADVQEILPGMRLLRQATSVHEIDYEKAREEFLRGLQEGGLTSPPLRDFLNKDRAKTEVENGSEAAENKTAPGAALPGIQTLSGRWSGTLQAFGGGGGASTLNFNLTGESWKWGEYEVDEAITVGSYHSAEGVHLEEVSLSTGTARFALRGDLFGPKQAATFMLNDFPAALLSPLYKTVPALQNAVPAMTDHTQGIKRLMDRWERTKTTFGLSDSKEVAPMEKLTKGSPVNGLLFVRGTIGGSVDQPEGIVELDLYDGMVGTTLLSMATAQVELGAQRVVEFKLESAPLESKGHLRIEGSVPFPQADGAEDATVRLRVHDGGMAIVAALIPDFKWEAGHASIDLSIHGKISDPEIEGRARISRAILSVPNLRYPLKHTTGTVRVEDGKLVVDQFETKSGNHGQIKAKGRLPILKNAIQAGSGDELSVSVSRLELKVNSVYNGRLDSHLKLRRCLKEPVVSGDIEISKGIAVLQFGAFATAPPTEATTAVAAHRPGAMRFQHIQLPSQETVVDMVPSMLNIPKQVPMGGIRFEKLNFKLGPELRFQVPFMVNLILSGGIEVSGPPKDLTPTGEIYITGGMVNLFATQLSVDREDSPGTVRFVAEQGFDPDLDFTLTSQADGFKAICKGRASSWQENVVLRFSGVEGTDEENLSQSAKVFQSKLADALVAENGQLALVNLAASTMATMSPRLDTWGQIGGARWRIVSAPNIPYLLTNSEKLDFQDIVTSLLSGTEIEVQYGPTQAVIAHKMQGASAGLQWNLALNFTDNLKLSAGVVNTPSITTSVLLQYSSSARTRMK